jgi:hypothetical protein
MAEVPLGPFKEVEGADLSGFELTRKLLLRGATIIGFLSFHVDLITSPRNTIGPNLAGPTGGVKRRPFPLAIMKPPLMLNRYWLYRSM